MALNADFWERDFWDNGLRTTLGYAYGCFRIIKNAVLGSVLKSYTLATDLGTAWDKTVFKKKLRFWDRE